MEEEQLKLLDKAEQVLEKAIRDFEVGIDLFFSEKMNDILSELYDMIEFPKARIVDVSRNAANLIVINKFRGVLSKFIEENEEYRNVVEIIENALNEVIVLNEKYFFELVSSFDKQAYKALYKQSLGLVRETLIGSGMQATLVNPVIDKILKDNLQGIKRKELEKLMNEYFTANNLPKRYIKQQASDTLYQLTSNYQQVVSSDLGLKHYLYAGTAIDTTRNFCNTRVGRVFTQKEVEGWASLSWDGKIAGTSKNSIFVYRGGWNCRHTLRPISESLYNKLNNK